MSRLSRADASHVLSWLRHRFGVVTERIALCESQSAGMGVSASSRCEAGDVLLAVPAQAWEPFSALHARATCPPRALAEVERHTARLGGGANQLADAVLLANAIANTTASTEHAPYLSRLPMPDVPLLWPPPLRAALLQGSSAERSAQQQAALSASCYSTLSTALTEAGGSPAPTEQLFQWAQALLLSRAHSGHGKPLALVPGLDLLNHGGADASADVRFDDATANFLLVARRAHAREEEVTIDYGTDASHRLLRLYGFVLDETADEGVRTDADYDSVPPPQPREEVSLSLMPPTAELAKASDDVQQAWRGQHRMERPQL